MSVTKEQFSAYERVRRGGRYNMLADSIPASVDAGLDPQTYFEIIDKYRELSAKWPDVRSSLEGT